METETNTTELSINIDFDLAKREWRKNKKQIGMGTFKYTCQYVHTSGKKCNKVVYSQIDNKNYGHTRSETRHMYNYNFGGTASNLYNPPLVDDPIIKKACKQHMNRVFKFKL